MDVSPFCFCTSWDVNWTIAETVGVWLASLAALIGLWTAIRSEGRSRLELQESIASRARMEKIATGSARYKIVDAYQRLWHWMRDASRMRSDHQKGDLLEKRLEEVPTDIDADQLIGTNIPEDAVTQLLEAMRLLRLVKDSKSEQPRGILAPNVGLNRGREAFASMRPAYLFVRPHADEQFDSDPATYETDFERYLREQSTDRHPRDA